MPLILGEYGLFFPNPGSRHIGAAKELGVTNIFFLFAISILCKTLTVLCSFLI